MSKKQNPKIDELMHAISLIENQEEATRFFTDLCTPAELEAMADRWQVVPMVRLGIPYRTINERTGVSVATITRIARCINLGEGGYSLIADRLTLTWNSSGTCICWRSFSDTCLDLLVL